MGVISDGVHWSVAGIDGHIIVIVALVLVTVVAVVILILVAVRIGRVERILANVPLRFSSGASFRGGGEEKDPRPFYTTFDRFEDELPNPAPYGPPPPQGGHPPMMGMMSRPQQATSGGFGYHSVPFGFVGCNSPPRYPPAPGMTAAEIAAKKTDERLYPSGAVPLPTAARQMGQEPGVYYDSEGGGSVDGGAAAAAQVHYRMKGGARPTREQRREQLYDENLRQKQEEYHRTRDQRRGARGGWAVPVERADFQPVRSHQNHPIRGAVSDGGPPLRMRQRRRVSMPPSGSAPPRRPPPSTPPKTKGMVNGKPLPDTRNGVRKPPTRLQKAAAAAAERRSEELHANGVGRAENGVGVEEKRGDDEKDTVVGSSDGSMDIDEI